MITPINGHLLIEPVQRESFVVSDKNTYHEKGRVISNGNQVFVNELTPMEGQVVYFDSWLAAKYPKNDKEFFWLVKMEDVRAVEDAEIPK